MAPVSDTISGSAATILSLAQRSGPAALSTLHNLIRRGDRILITTSAAALSTLQTRQENEADNPTHEIPHGQGTIQPESIPTNALFAIFGLIGAGFVITAIWFFFITPNGGFVFRDGDWEEYKSTVLRRKGPNGTTLSGATESTDLGGASVVGRRERKRFLRRERGEKSVFSDETSYTGYDARKSDISGSTAVSDSYGDGRTEYTQTEDAMTSITRGVSGRYQREKIQFSRRDQLKLEKEAAKAAKRAEKAARERAKEEAKARKSRAKYHDEESSVGFEQDRYDNATGFDDAATSVYDDKDFREYREEKPARVGGINMPSSSTAFGSAAGMSEVTESLIAGRQETPRNSPEKKSRRDRRVRDDYTEVSTEIELPSPTKGRDRERGAGGGGIRKVDTVYESDRLKAEARRLRDKGRAAAANSALAAEQRGSKPKRNFSYTPGDDGLSNVSEESREARRARRAERLRERGVPGGFGGSEISGTTATASALSEESGTKSYHHPIPGLSSSAAASDADYAEERRRRRAEGANFRRE